MVGHTGVWDAAVSALATIDHSLARVVEALTTLDAADRDGPGSLLVVTSDHGNADEMRDEDGRPVTAHSLNPVPIVFVGRAVAGRRLRNGVLADVAPTIVELAGLPRWDGMTGRSLLEPAPSANEASASSPASARAGSVANP
jgi:2,3-bisphosphoglycerate-independent phosphoglycerate mutase